LLGFAALYTRIYILLNTLGVRHHLKLSVVTVSLDRLAIVDQCLKALEKQRGDFDAEIIVVSCNQITVEHIRKNFPRIKLLQIPERLGIPALRAIGIGQATGDIIAITEDRCVASETWFEEIIKAHSQEYDAVGGAIENGSRHRIMDWAVYLCEYSHSMLPIPYGEVERLAGNNAAYKKAVFDKIDQTLVANYWEFFIHEELHKQGIKFLSVPSIVVQKTKQFGFLYYLTQRFHYSRSFAAMRATKVSPLKRLLYASCTPCLPFVMIWRIGQQVLFKRRCRKEFFLALPILAFFMLSYALGELTGYLFGSGKSLLKVA
jgi:GT2 family glycosyltransferase